jgi:hypothetical protein
LKITVHPGGGSVRAAFFRQRNRKEPHVRHW